MAVKKQAKHWKDLKKSPKKKNVPLSFNAKLRKFYSLFKFTSIILIVCALLGGFWYVYQSGLISEYLYKNSDCVKKVIFKSDGKISAKWMVDFVEIEKETPLALVNIFQIKEKIENLSQVKSASIVKVYPDTIQIEIEEHDSFAKIFENNTRNKILIMSSDGTFYTPVCFDEDALAALPLIIGINPIKSGNIYLAYPKANRVKKLFDLAQKRIPTYVSTWTAIDLSGAQNIVLPLIYVHTKDDIRITFLDKDFENQLDKLEYVLRYLAANPINGIESIDLSMKGRSDLEKSPLSNDNPIIKLRK